MDTVAILDAGAQYGKVIDRRVRELSVRTSLLPLDTPASVLREEGYRAVIISGGPQSVSGPEAPAFDPKVFQAGLPVLGICYGMQLINIHHGGGVQKGAIREDGKTKLKIDTTCPLFNSLNEEESVLLTHGDSVTTVAPGFKEAAWSLESKIVSCIYDKEKRIYGVQFHPEVDLTDNGTTMLSNFLLQICRLRPCFTLENRGDAAIRRIREQVGDASVLVLVSGGVDSTVCAALVSKAIGTDRVFALHIDNGFMRLNESDKVEKALAKLQLNLNVVDATAAFMGATTSLAGGLTSPALLHIIDPETKRKIIGDTFMTVSQSEIKRLGLDLENQSVFLAQGTLRPDLIESASKNASTSAETIKTHHNDTPLVRTLRSAGRILEPLSDLHKDEVRALGIELGLDAEFVWRQPFPGPGLAVRVICSDGSISDSIREQQSDAQAQLDKLCADTAYRCTILPIQTVGVQGDGRSYSLLAGLTFKEPMVLNQLGKMDWDLLFRFVQMLTNRVHHVNRVVLVMGGDNGEVQCHLDTSGAALRPTYLRTHELQTLREADDIVNSVLLEHRLHRTLSQVPVILTPIDMDSSSRRCIALRPFITRDFMTGIPAEPGQHLPVTAVQQMVSSILTLSDVSHVLYDVTAKPPATTEWE